MKGTGAKLRVSADLNVTKREHVTDGSPCWCDPLVIHVPGGATVNEPANVSENRAAST